MKRIQLFAMGLAFVAGCGANEPPHALTSRELANVTAFANALGYIRFFHPTDAAVGVNWDAFAVRGIRAVQRATSADSLASALTAVFAPITSNVRFAKAGAPLPTTIPKPADATHVVFWRHFSLGSPSGGTGSPTSVGAYHSERVVAPLTEIGNPISLDSIEGTIVSLPPVPDPSHPMIAALGGGVSMSMPIALFTHADFVEESLRVPSPSLVMERFSANDRATRLADIALAWSLLAHFYPYFDVVHTDWPAALDTALRSAATDADGDAFRATLQRLMAALHDGHGFVRVSSGAQLQTHDVNFDWAEGHVLVTAVGDSAAASGLRFGDEVLAVDGQLIQTKLAERSTRISGATPQFIRRWALRMLLDGDPRTRAQLRVSAADGAARDVSLLRTSKVAAKPKAIDSVTEVSPGVMYIDLDRSTEADFDAAMPRLQRAKAVILDMRGYPRSSNPTRIFAHFTDTLLYSPRFLIPVNTLPNFHSVGFVDQTWTVAPAAPRLTARMIILSSGGAVSAAETALGLVEENQLGDIVGEPSAGTNGMIDPFALPGGYTVNWTGMLVQKRDGTPHHGVGIIPTVPASPTVAGIRAGRDEVLERAISLETGRVNPTGRGAREP
jgi:C-terminal processing protease CtpA/Prc